MSLQKSTYQRVAQENNYLACILPASVSGNIGADVGGVIGGIVLVLVAIVITAIVTWKLA